MIRSGEAPGVGWSRSMLYSECITLPRSIVRRQTAARISTTLSHSPIMKDDAVKHESENSTLAASPWREIGGGIVAIFVGVLVAIATVYLLANSFPNNKDIMPVAFLVAVCLGAFLGIMTKRSMLQQHSGLPAPRSLSEIDTNQSEALTPCKNCGRVIALSTVVCPKCMMRSTEIQTNVG